MSQSPLKLRINEAMKEAMRAKNKSRLGTIRLALAEIKKVEVDEQIDLDDIRITSLLDKMVKQSRESIKQFEAGGRNDLATNEQHEIEIIQEFLPKALSEEELDTIIGWVCVCYHSGFGHCVQQRASSDRRRSSKMHWV